MQMSDFFQALRGKIEIVPSQDFDRRFWDAFEKENPKEKPSTRGKSPLFLEWVRSIFAPRGLAFGSAIAASVIGAVYVAHHLHSVSSPTSEVVVIAKPQNAVAMNEMMDEKPMLDQLDLYMAFDVVTAITEQEWKVLLADT
jgi:hypothetical protein